MAKKTKIPSPGTISTLTGRTMEDVGIPNFFLDASSSPNYLPALTMSYSQPSTSSSPVGDGNEFFEGYRAGIQVQFQEDQVVLCQYRDRIRQLQEEVEEYRRQEVIKEGGRRREQEVERQIRQDLHKENLRLEQLRQNQEQEKGEIAVQYARSRSRETRYREKLANVTKELTEANDRLLAMEVAYGDVSESWEWDQGPEWDFEYRSTRDESSSADQEISTESTLLSDSSDNSVENNIAGEPKKETPGLYYVDSDGEYEASHSMGHAYQRDESKDCAGVAWKGKAKEDFRAIGMQGYSSGRHNVSSSKNQFDIEIDVETGISDSGSFDSDVEVDVKSWSESSISLNPEDPDTKIRDVPAASFVPEMLCVPQHKLAAQSHASLSELDVHQLMALMKAAHEDGYQSGDSESSTSLKKIKYLIQEAERVPKQKRNALEIYLLTNWRKPSRRKMKLPAPQKHISIPTVFVDASGYGIGLIMPDGRWLAWTFAVGNPRIPIAPDKHIVMSWAELIAVELGILTLIAAGHRNTRILVRSDNDGVVGALLRRTWTSSYGLDTILRRILLLCNSPAKRPGDGKSPYNLDLSVMWVPSKENPADGPSRGVYPSKNLMLKDPAIIPEYLMGLVLPVV